MLLENSKQRMQLLGVKQTRACSAEGRVSVSPAKCRPTAVLVPFLSQTEPLSPPLDIFLDIFL